MINEELWKKKPHKMMPPFVSFYNMHAATFVLPDEIADVWIAGMQCFFLYPN